MINPLQAMRTGQNYYAVDAVKFQCDGYVCFDQHSALKSGTNEEGYGLK
jgi:hypothetical protein